MNSVVKITPLSEELVETEAESIIFICRSNFKIWDLVIKAIKSMRERNVILAIALLF